MSRIRNRLMQDKALRDAALHLFKTDIDVIRSELNARTIGARLADRLSEGALEIMDDAVDYADGNRGKVAAVVAAVLLWFARDPILRAAGLKDDEAEDEPAMEPDGGRDGSDRR